MAYGFPETHPLYAVPDPMAFERLSSDTYTQVKGVGSRHMKKTFGNIGIVIALALAGTSVASADTSTLGLNVPQLGTAKTYAVLTATRIENNGFTNTASTTQGNDLGISTSNDISNWDERDIVGWTHFNDAAARTAQDDLSKAYVKASVLKATAISSQLGGRTLKPGVYVSKTGQFWITGTLTLDTMGNPNARFVFRTVDSMRTSARSKVVVKGGRLACQVYWRIPGIATLGQDSTMVGHVMSNTYIILQRNVKLYGQVLVRKGGAFLYDSYIKNQVCR